jgi:flagellar hook-associated protein 2
MAISSVGAGTGILTTDILDKLKAADVAATVTPIDTKTTLQTQKNSALALLDSLLTTFQGSVKALDDDALYQKRTVSGNTDSVSVTADSGVAVQTMSITDTVLAQKSIVESGAFTSTADKIATGTGTLTLSIDGTDFTIDYTADMTVDLLKDAINAATGGKIKASTLQVGTADSRLILTSGETGLAQKITLSDSVGGTLKEQLLPYNATGSDDAITDNPNGIQEIQPAKDASFKYNGITVIRPTNTITDIVTGVSINLLKDAGSANVSISQNVQAINDELSLFVTNYNALTSQLTSMTTSDTTAGTVGIFNGDSSINGITREVNNLLTSINGDGLSLAQFGIDLSQDGVMSYDSSIFTTQFNKDTSLSEKFFSGLTTTTTTGTVQSVDGLFTSMSTLMDNYTKTDGTIDTLTAGGTAELTRLDDAKIKAQALLDTRYETMTARFIQYDLMMTKLNNQFASLQQQIDMAANGG